MTLKATKAKKAGLEKVLKECVKIEMDAIGLKSKVRFYLKGHKGHGQKRPSLKKCSKTTSYFFLSIKTPQVQ